MPQANATKNYYQFNRGINSESSELTLEDGYSVDEANYELLVDGSRKRRRGLTQEASGGTITTSTVNMSTNTVQHYVWRSAGGDPTSNFIVHKIGDELFFTPDSDGGSASVHATSIDLGTLSFGGLSMATEAIDMTQGRGVLFISGKNIYPTAVVYDPVGDSFSTTPIEIQIRDYEGIDDGVAIDTQVESGQAGAAVIADIQSGFPDHYYNLLTRGWSADSIIDYENNITGTARYPAKQQWWAKGWKRVDATAGVELSDGTYQFDAAKLDAEIFGGSDAPTGSMILNVFDDTYGFKEVSLDSSGTFTSITGGNLAATDGASKWTVRVTDASHTFSVSDEVNWKDKPTMAYPGVPARIPIIFSETSTITAVSAGVYWEFEIFDFNEAYGWTDTLATFSNCSYWGVDPVARSNGTGPLTTGPTAIEFHGGRLWYAGIQDSPWNDYIFFSQVVRSEDNYKRCHTDADPTAPNFNSPVITDGGFIILENIGTVKKLLSMENSLLIFSDQGVWEISSQGSFFDPTNYKIRKITTAECGSAYSPILVEGTCIYTGPKGIYLIAPDQYTRQLEATNISDPVIRSKWNAITDTYEPYVKTMYDDAQKRVYFFTPGNANLLSGTGDNISTTDLGSSLFTVVWIFDLRVGAFYKYEFNSNVHANAVCGGFVLTGQDSANGKRKAKFLVNKSTTTFIVCDFDEDEYQDFDGNSPVCQVISPHFNVGTYARRIQAPIITVFQKRTETGYTESGNGYAPVNESSTTMQARWDWSDDTVTGKLGASSQVYRHTRGFAPSGTGDVDGYPVVVTRNKVRGRGRALQLVFKGSISASPFDSHILGFTVDYKVSRRK